MIGRGPLRSSERRIGIKVGWGAIGHEVAAPGALDVGAVGEPELLAYQLQALEDCEGLRGRPVRGQRENEGFDTWSTICAVFECLELLREQLWLAYGPDIQRAWRGQLVPEQLTLPIDPGEPF